MRTASACGALLALAACGAPGPERVQAIARTYRSYGPVDDLSRWAPWGCRAPQPGETARTSASRDGSTHGRKLYYLFAKDRTAYLHARELDQPVGQILVKESWIPSPLSTVAHPLAEGRGPLFIMEKTGEPESDEGWVYATVAPDGATVTAFGRLESCRSCHESARRDRLFGPTSCAAPE